MGTKYSIQGLLNITGVHGIMHRGERVKWGLNAGVIYINTFYRWCHRGLRICIEQGPKSKMEPKCKGFFYIRTVYMGYLTVII